MRKTILVIAAFILFDFSITAQLDRGYITGVVVDPTGAAIPAVEIAIENAETNGVHRFSTNQLGQFTAPNLPVGHYRIVFRAKGFTTTVREGLRLDAAQVARVDIQLQLGAPAESVTVSAVAALLETETAQVGTLLDQRGIIDLPLSFSGGRYPEDFAYELAAGVEGNRWESRINGSPAFLKEVLLDGSSITTYIAGNFGESSVPLEALEEFKVQTSGFGADLDRTGGGVFNFVMKSGTNQIHGGAAGLLRNENLNANTFADNFYGRARQRDRQHDAAFSLGGPAWLPGLYTGRNRTFFYAAYEQYRESNTGLGSPSVTVPLLEWYDGDLSRYLTSESLGTDALGRDIKRGALYDPAATRVVDGRIVRDLFPNNVIPAYRISKVAAKVAEIMKKYYAPQVTQADGQDAMVSNSFFPVSTMVSFDQKQFSVKADHILSARQKLAGMFAYVRRPRVLVDSGGVWSAEAADGGPFSKARLQNVTTYMARLAHDFTIGPELLNHLSISANRQVNLSASTHAGEAGASILGIQGVEQNSNYPQINWSGGDRVNLANIGYTKNDVIGAASYELANTVSWRYGRHFLRFGLDAGRNSLNYRDTAGPVTFSFSQEQTGLPGYSLTGSSFASFLLGEVSSATVVVGTPTSGQLRSLGAFVQDDYKVTPRLTMNLGLRWGYAPVQTEKYNRLTNFAPDVIDPATGLAGGIEYAGIGEGRNGRRGFVRNHYANFGPRIGLAWMAAPRVVFRAGYGLLYHGRAFNDWTGDPAGSVTQYGLGWGQSSKAVSPGAGQAAFQWDNGYAGVLQQNTPDASAADYVGYAVSWDPNAGKVGYTQQWNVNLQFELPAGTVLDLGYVGSHSTGIVANQLRNILQIPTSALSLGSVLGQWVDSDAAIPTEAKALGTRYPYQESGTWVPVYQLLQKYPQIPSWGTVVSYGSPLGFSTYNSLQVSLTKRYSGGLSFLTNYTFSKSIGNVESAFQTYSNYGRPMDYYNLGLEKSVSWFDQTHVVKAAVSYQLPLGRGKKFGSGLNRAWNAVVEGWTIQYIGNYRSGFPLGFSGTATPNSNFATNRAQIVNPNGEALTVPFDSSRFDMSLISTPGAPANRYINTAVVTDPPAYARGNASFRLSQIRDFPLYSEDVGVQRNFTIAEKFRLQFRAEFLNLFNRHRLTFNASDGALDTASPLFGQVSGVDSTLYRQTQLGVRLDF